VSGRPLGRRLRDRRLATGMSQRRLAARLGRPHSLVSMWESGLREPCLADLAGLSRVLGVRVEELIAGTRASPRRISSRAHGAALRRRIGAQIRTRRRTRGLSPADIRAATGIRGRRLRRIEEGADANAAELEAMRTFVDDYARLVWEARHPAEGPSIRRPLNPTWLSTGEGTGRRHG
jgi:transcriptional regulator with XRE-family HTH domain